jgi:hypothetical protein
MGRYLRDLRDALKRQPPPEVPAEPEESAAAVPLSGDESKPTLMVKGTRAGVEDLVSGRFLASSDPVVDGFVIVPAKAVETPPTPEKPHWRIELAYEDPAKLPLRLQIGEAATIGRGRAAHIRIDEEEAELRGISREHAMFRPSPRALFFFDLESKNGSHHNGIPMGPGMAMTISLGDVIRLGTLSLTVRRIERVS